MITRVCPRPVRLGPGLISGQVPGPQIRCRLENLIQSSRCFRTPGYVPRRSIPVTLPRAPLVSACLTAGLNHLAAWSSASPFRDPPTSRFPLTVGRVWLATLDSSQCGVRPCSKCAVSRPWNHFSRPETFANSTTWGNPVEKMCTRKKSVSGGRRSD